MTHKVGIMRCGAQVQSSDNVPKYSSSFDIVRLERVKTTEADEDEAFDMYIEYVGKISEEVRP